jgi:hypothetical protein
MNKYLPSMEMIQYQKNSTFGRDLEVAITVLAGRGYGITQRDVDESKLSKIIKDNSGITVNFVLVPDYAPIMAVDIPQFGSGNVLTNKWLKQYVGTRHSDALAANNNGIKGSVDLAKGKVSGDFSDHIVNIYIASYFFAGDVKAACTAAALLHEIGHVFTIFELMDRIASTNQFLAAVVGEVLGTSDVKKKMQIVSDLNSKLKYGFNSVDELIAAKTDAEVAIVVLADEVVNCRSELGFNIYDQRAAEQLADQYVARLGYGKELADLMTILAPFHATHGLFARITVGMLAAMVMVALPPLFVLIMYISVDLQGESVYDTPKRRIEVIRADVLRSIRYSKGITLEMLKKTLADLDSINKNIDKLNDSATISTLLARWIRGVGGKSTQIQKLLEDLSASRLNESYGRLKLLESGHA